MFTLFAKGLLIFFSIYSVTTRKLLLYEAFFQLKATSVKTQPTRDDLESLRECFLQVSVIESTNLLNIWSTWYASSFYSVAIWKLPFGEDFQLKVTSDKTQRLIVDELKSFKNTSRSFANWTYESSKAVLRTKIVNEILFRTDFAKYLAYIVFFY